MRCPVVSRKFRESLFPDMVPSRQPLLRSQSGPSAAFSVTPSSALTRIKSPLFRVLFQRRLICGCGRPTDSFGHHRAAGKKVVPTRKHGSAHLQGSWRPCGSEHAGPEHGLGSACGRRCKTSGGGCRRIPPLGGVQLAVDTTLVSALRGDGNPSRGAATRDGVALSEARRDKERTYPELVGLGARARLVVLPLEVGGRWSPVAARQSESSV